MKGGEDNVFPPASKPTLSAPVSGPSELVFAQFQVPAVGHVFEGIRITRPPQCDGCGYALAAGGLAYGCRAANCDLCGACYEATKSKRPPKMPMPISGADGVKWRTKPAVFQQPSHHPQGPQEPLATSASLDLPKPANSIQPGVTVVAIHSFQAHVHSSSSSPDTKMLDMFVGDTIEITCLSKSGYWVAGTNRRTRTTGWVPLSHIEAEKNAGVVLENGKSSYDIVNPVIWWPSR